MATGQRRGSQGEQSAPKSSPFPHSDILRDIQKEWNKAESAIKRSEQGLVPDAFRFPVSVAPHPTDLGQPKT